MRRFLLLTLVVFILTMSVASAEMVVKIPDTSGAVGGTVEVPVEVENAQNLGSMDIVIVYDPTILKVQNVGKGELNKGLLSSNTGEGMVAISLADSKGINGKGSVAVITFQVLKAGSTDLTIQSVKAYDVNTHVDIPVKADNGKFEAVKGGAGTTGSTPGFELLLAVSALIAVGLFRKKIG
ncbi:cohesin domain-containing protein [Archaeoglobus fulgidus]|uniref:cohesin domain-containing protein n=1 Tax=Archaeoglobus fulgidus TaxID=2234 RepID=UPI001305117A|nr:cohesin domain-containing protein [Archaeoglobus fulgidus]